MNMRSRASGSPTRQSRRLGAADRLRAPAHRTGSPCQGGARGVRPRGAAPLRPEQHPLRHEHAHRRVGPDKNARWALLMRGATIRSCGTSARRHATIGCSRRGCRPRTSGRASRRCVARCPTRPEIPDRLADKIATELRERGCSTEPVGVDMADLVTIEALQRAGIQVTDGSRVMLEARTIKTAEEIACSTRHAGSSTPSTTRSTACCGRACTSTRSSRAPTSSCSRWARSRWRPSTPVSG